MYKDEINDVACMYGRNGSSEMMTSYVTRDNEKERNAKQRDEEPSLATNKSHS